MKRTQRLPLERIPHAVLRYKPVGKRSVGRPRKRWDDILWSRNKKINKVKLNQVCWRQNTKSVCLFKTLVLAGCLIKIVTSPLSSMKITTNLQGRGCILSYYFIKIGTSYPNRFDFFSGFYLRFLPTSFTYDFLRFYVQFSHALYVCALAPAQKRISENLIVFELRICIFRD